MGTPTTANDFKVFGIDISKYQGDEMQSLNKEKDKLTFIICKATEGKTYTDPYFKKNWPLIQSKGYVRGAYHFYRTNTPSSKKDDQAKQAANYLNAVVEFLDHDFPPIVDFEEQSIKSDTNKESIQPDLLLFLKILEEKTGRKPLIYTNNNTANEYLKDPAFANYDLWIARYNKNSPLPLPKVWKSKTWTLWQQTDQYKLNGYNNDFDVFNGDSEAFKNYIKSTNVK